MPDTEEIRLAVPRDQVDAIRSAVANGEYESTSAVVVEALREWQTRRTEGREDAERLRRLWQEGLSSGPSEPLNIAEIKTRGRELLPRVPQV